MRVSDGLVRQNQRGNVRAVIGLNLKERKGTIFIIKVVEGVGRDRPVYYGQKIPYSLHKDGDKKETVYRENTKEKTNDNFHNKDEKVYNILRTT